MTQELKKMYAGSNVLVNFFFKKEDISGVTMHLQLLYSLSYNVLMMYMEIMKMQCERKMSNYN